jgi:hypothetical protein
MWGMRTKHVKELDLKEPPGQPGWLWVACPVTSMFLLQLKLAVLCFVT